jgi:hypothetical protein
MRVESQSIDDYGVPAAGRSATVAATIAVRGATNTALGRTSLLRPNCYHLVRSAPRSWLTSASTLGLPVRYVRAYTRVGVGESLRGGGPKQHSALCNEPGTRRK